MPKEEMIRDLPDPPKSEWQNEKQNAGFPVEYTSSDQRKLYPVVNDELLKKFRVHYCRAKRNETILQSHVQRQIVEWE